MKSLLLIGHIGKRADYMPNFARKISKNWYYLENSGKMASNRWVANKK